MINEFEHGHTGSRPRINVRNVVQRLRYNPLIPLMEVLHGGDYTVLENDFSRYWEAYEFYFLSMDRYLHEMSIAVRWRKGPYFVRRYGGSYTDRERKLAHRYNEIAGFLKVDFFNCLIHARILLDRVVAFSRYFLPKGESPSFTSFSQHKRYFQRVASPYGKHEEYAEYFRNNTNWFDMPLKIVRDKYLVHAGPKHIRIFGYSEDGADLGIHIMVPDLSEVSDVGNWRGVLQGVIHVSVPQMIDEVDEFLNWYNAYALKVLNG